MCYVDCTLHHRQTSEISDKAADLELHLFCDADFAGDHENRKSTSGVFLRLSGPAGSRVGLTGVSKKQSCVSHSTPEAELVALDFALRTEGIPALSLWSHVLRRPIMLTIQEDNQATLKILESGKSQALRHVGRVHDVSLAWLHERLTEDKQITAVYCDTKLMAADIMTKGFTNSERWQHALTLIGVEVSPVAEPERAAPKISVVRNINKSSGSNVQQQSVVEPVVRSRGRSQT